MTEQQWWKCPNQLELLEHVQGQARPRKLRLYVCALTRDDWEWLRTKPSQRGIEVAEKFADGQATAKQFKAAHQAAFDAMQAWGERWATEQQTNTTYAVQRRLRRAPPPKRAPRPAAAGGAGRRSGGGGLCRP